MTERAELMGIYRSNGISSISLMRDHYNGLAGYLDSRPDKKLSRDIEDKNYVGVASDLAEGVTEG